MLFQQKVFPIVAFHFMNDEGSNIDLAQENGNFHTAVATAKEIDKKLCAIIGQNEKNNPWGQGLIEIGNIVMNCTLGFTNSLYYLVNPNRRKTSYGLLLYKTDLQNRRTPGSIGE